MVPAVYLPSSLHARVKEVMARVGTSSSKKMLGTAPKFLALYPIIVCTSFAGNGELYYCHLDNCFNCRTAWRCRAQHTDAHAG